MEKFIQKITADVLQGYAVDKKESLKLASVSGPDLNFLFAGASRIREHFKGNTVSLCSIINAKSGRCSENCAFCAQSSWHKTNAPVYPLAEEKDILRRAEESERMGAHCFGIVTSGSEIKPGKDLELICNALRLIRSKTSVKPSCSLGILDKETAAELKEAGMATYHHNLETSRSYFPRICTTHDYEKDVETVRSVKSVGLKVCCGGIFGLGESFEHRIELAETLRELNADTIPINFLTPLAGTPLAEANFLTPLECLKIIAIYRFILPDKNLTVCGGREKNLRELQSWIFLAGANGMMTGDYLTTQGRDPEQDRRMLADLELSVEQCK